MATELMIDWIVELFNPERKQTTGQLGRLEEDGTRSHCCLGVLCEVAGVVPSAYADDTLRYDGMYALPPYWVLGDLFNADPLDLISDDNVSLGKDEQGDTLYADKANDELGWDFPTIAKRLMTEYLDEGERSKVIDRVHQNGWKF